jgi:hypothetical protein
LELITKRGAFQNFAWTSGVNAKVNSPFCNGLKEHLILEPSGLVFAIADGYNIGINNLQAAGQTIPHVHIHLIPRYQGDVSHPQGGVRGVIPAMKEY